MFDSLPHHFRQHKLHADVRTLLMLRTAMEKGLVNTLGDLFLVLKGLVTRDPRDFGPFTTAFYAYFLAIDIKKGERLESAILRSETFKSWKEALAKEEKWEKEPYSADLIDRFLYEVHLTTLDIKKMVSGRDILNDTDADMADRTGEDDPSRERKVEEGADYREISTKELQDRLREIAKQQAGRHTGGNHWAGTGGKSPFGSMGVALAGMRLGGRGGGKMARAVIGDPNFYPVDVHVALSDDSIDIALATLKGIEEETAEMKLDIPNTIKEGLKQGGIFLPYEIEEVSKKVQVVLLIDNGGLSMTPYIKNVTKVFKKMKTRFAHDLKTYYFHNTIYKGVYSDMRRRTLVPMEKLLTLDKNYSFFVIGDADMARYELTPTSMDGWESIKDRFVRLAWLNPLHEKYWNSSDTVPMLRNLISMYPLTPDGISKAVEKMNRKRRYVKS